MADLGLATFATSGHEQIQLPLVGQTVEVVRLHPEWELAPRKASFAGIPNKRVLGGPASVAGVSPALAVAKVVAAAVGQSCWWAVWGSEVKGVGAATNRREEYPPGVAHLVAAISARTREIMIECDRESEECDIPWRRDHGKPSQRGGLWDVVTVDEHGSPLFAACKSPTDRLRDNQRAFLEAGLELFDVDRFISVSWRHTA